MTDESTVDFGAHLRLAREKRGLTLQQIAATTKISARVLASLERNDISILPGGIFSRAFVRSYAREIGLDPDATVELFVSRFPAESAPAPAPVSSSEDPVEFESGRRVATTLLQLVGLSVVVVVAALIYFNLRGSSKVPSPSETPRSIAPARSAEPSAPPAATAGETSPSPLPDAVQAPSSDTAAAPSGDARGAGANAAALPSVPASTPAAAPAEATAPLRVTLTAKGQCWVSLTVDGTRTVARVLQAGERFTYPAQNEILLNVGDAGAVSLTINDAPARPLGAPGAVVTTRITPDNFRTLLGRQ
jgi:cytoskeleton protein RodZ